MNAGEVRRVRKESLPVGVPRIGRAGIAVGVAVFMFIWVLWMASAAVHAAPGHADEDQTHIYTLLDERGRVLFQTGLQVQVGDRFLNEDNQEYEVVRVSGRFAHVKAGRRVDLRGALVRAYGSYPLPQTGILGANASPQGPIGVYHTHSDESYKPTSGKTNEPFNGDIFQVGTILSENLRAFGLRVNHSPDRHDPHDGEAYHRSRRTATKMLKQGPDALFDVHRDTPPPEVYQTSIQGKDATKVLIVVGRQNPNMHVNEKFAFALKDYADKNIPGLVRGIFYARGGYNQDLFPRALLLEVGSTFNSLGEAENGIGFFGGVVPAVLYGMTKPQAPPARGAEVPVEERAARESRSGWWTALVILAVAGVGVVGYVVLNEGSWESIVERLGSGVRGVLGLADGDVDDDGDERS